MRWLRGPTIRTTCWISAQWGRDLVSTGWYRFTQSPGLLLWRRSTNYGHYVTTMLIPADGRSIFDARRQPVQAEPTTTDPSYTYVWQDPRIQGRNRLDAGLLLDDVTIFQC